MFSWDKRQDCLKSLGKQNDLFSNGDSGTQSVIYCGTRTQTSSTSRGLAGRAERRCGSRAYMKSLAHTCYFGMPVRYPGREAMEREGHQSPGVFILGGGSRGDSSHLCDMVWLCRLSWPSALWFKLFSLQNEDWGCVQTLSKADTLERSLVA